MKRLIIIGLVIALMFVSGCGKENKLKEEKNIEENIEDGWYNFVVQGDTIRIELSEPLPVNVTTVSFWVKNPKIYLNGEEIKKGEGENER